MIRIHVLTCGEVGVDPILLEPERTGRAIGLDAGSEPAAERMVRRVAFEQADDGVEIVDDVVEQDRRCRVVDHGIHGGPVRAGLPSDCPAPGFPSTVGGVRIPPCGEGRGQTWAIG